MWLPNDMKAARCAQYVSGEYNEKYTCVDALKGITTATVDPRSMEENDRQTDGES